jgi:hypothetical protein
VKATADRRWEALLEEKKLGLITDMPNRISFHRQMIMEFFEKESEEVMEEVERYRQSDSVDENSYGDDDNNNNGDPEIKAQRANVGLIFYQGTIWCCINSPSNPSTGT